MFVVSDMEETRHNNQTKQDAESAKEKKTANKYLGKCFTNVCKMDNIIDSQG